VTSVQLGTSATGITFATACEVDGVSFEYVRPREELARRVRLLPDAEAKVILDALPLVLAMLRRELLAPGQQSASETAVAWTALCGEGRAAVARFARLLAAGGIDREALGREVRAAWVAWALEQPSPKASWLVPWEGLDEPDREVDRRIGERLFAMGAASVAPHDADLARVIAAWPALDARERASVVRDAVTVARIGFRVLAWDTLAPGAATLPTFVALTFGDGVAVVACDVDGEPATPEQWARLRAAGVPVAAGVEEKR